MMVAGRWSWKPGRRRFVACYETSTKSGNGNELVADAAEGGAGGLGQQVCTLLLYVMEIDGKEGLVGDQG